MSVKKLLATDPQINKLFELHCRGGYSPRSFMGKLYGGYNAFQRLMQNEEFKKINEKYKRKEPVSKLHGRIKQEISAT